MRRSDFNPSHRPDATMNAEDVGAALASVVLAVGASLHGVASRTTEVWLNSMADEIRRTTDVLATLPGEQPAGAAALHYVLEMLQASSPSRAPSATAQQPNETDMPSVAGMVCGMAQRRWPKSAARNLAKHAGVRRRSAEHWLSHGAGMSAEALAQLLRSEVGNDVLQAIMGDAQPAWWSSFRRADQNARVWQKLDDLRAEIEEVRRELD